MRTGFDLARDMIRFEPQRPSVQRFARRIPQDKKNRSRIVPYREKVLHRYASMWLMPFSGRLILAIERTRASMEYAAFRRKGTGWLTGNAPQLLPGLIGMIDQTSVEATVTPLHKRVPSLRDNDE